LASSREAAAAFELVFERAAAEALADDLPQRDANRLAAALRRVAVTPSRSMRR
jgi:hypothetical protein